MKVLVNAASIKEGGSKIVLNRLLAAMCEARSGVTWIVAADPTCITDGMHDSVRWIATPLGRSVIDIVRWYEYKMPALARRCGADVLFSLTNYLPRRTLPCPSLLLIQHAGHFSPVFDKLILAERNSPHARWLWRRKCRWVHRSAKQASVMTVQTKTLASAISAATKRAFDGIAVIPHGPGCVAHSAEPRVTCAGDPFTIGYISKWGVQKDFKTLLHAAMRLRRAGRRFKLVLTLDEAQPAAGDVLAAARRLGIADILENHGEVAEHRIASLYDSLDVFVFPSLCESFGFPMVEAMARGLPMIVAATPENLEIAAGAAFAFAPGNASELAALLARLIDDEHERTARSRLSLEASRSYSWDRAARETLAALDRAATAVR